MLMVSFRCTLNVECSSAFMMDMYESLRSVYLPTSAIITKSNSLSWLMVMKGTLERLLIMKASVCAQPDIISFHRFIKN